MSKIWPIFAYGSTDRLREKRTRGGVQNPENFAYVLNGCSQTLTLVVMITCAPARLDFPQDTRVELNRAQDLVG